MRHSDGQMQREGYGVSKTVNLQAESWATRISVRTTPIGNMGNYPH